MFLYIIITMDIWIDVVFTDINIRNKDWYNVSIW